MRDDKGLDNLRLSTLYRCRIPPAGGLGVSPILIKIPQDWWIQGIDQN